MTNDKLPLLLGDKEILVFVVVAVVVVFLRHFLLSTMDFILSEHWASLNYSRRIALGWIVLTNDEILFTTGLVSPASFD